MSTTTGTNGNMGSGFAEDLVRALPRLLAPGALPEDWDHRATTYDLTRFDSDEAFGLRFEQALTEILGADVQDPAELRARLAAVGLPFDYARLGTPLTTIYELYLQSKTQAARVFSFASATKPWLAVVESPTRKAPVRIYAEKSLPVSEEKKARLRAAGTTIHEGWQGPLPPPSADVVTVLVTESPRLSDVRGVGADAVCFTVPGGGVLLLADTARVDPKSIQLVRKRTVSALLTADARAALARVAGLEPPVLPEATEAACDALLRGHFPEVRDSFYFCTGLAAEAAVFTAAALVLGPEPVAFFHAQNGYGGTCQLIAELLPRECALRPVPLAVMAGGKDGERTLVDRVLAGLEELAGAPACVFLETPTNPELQAHDFEKLMTGLRAYAQRHGRKVPVIVDTTLSPLFPVFAKPFAQGWPFLLVKSGSKYFTKGKATLGIVACSEDALALEITKRARALGRDNDSFARPAQLAELREGLSDLAPRLAAISAHTIRLADGIRRALRAHGHEVTMYAISEAQVREGLGTGLLSFYLPPAPTTYPDLVDEFVAYLLEHAQALVKSRVSYGQSTGGGKPDVFYVINPEESTQGALPADVKNAQKRDNVQICRVSVPEHADVEGLLRAMEGFFASKYGR